MLDQSIPNPSVRGKRVLNAREVPFTHHKARQDNSVYLPGPAHFQSITQFEERLFTITQRIIGAGAIQIAHNGARAVLISQLGTGPIRIQQVVTSAFLNHLDGNQISLYISLDEAHSKSVKHGAQCMPNNSGAYRSCWRHRILNR